MATGHLLTCPLVRLQAFAGLQAQPCIHEDSCIVLSTARRAANVFILHDIPDLRDGEGVKGGLRPGQQCLHQLANTSIQYHLRPHRSPQAAHSGQSSVLLLDSELCPLS